MPPALLSSLTHPRPPPARSRRLDTSSTTELSRRALLGHHALGLAALTLSWLHRLRVATTRAERDALYRFRYETYVEERNRSEYTGVDHTRRMIQQPDDEAEGTIHLYFGETSNIRACVKLRCWAPGCVPEGLRQHYRLEELPELEELHLCDTTQLMVRPDLRGSLTMLLLTLRAGYYAVAERGVEAALTTCAPGLVSHYQRLGFRDFGAPPVRADVLLVPMVFLIGDLADSRKKGALWHYCARFGMRARGIPERSDTPFARRLATLERLRQSTALLRAELASSRSPHLAELSSSAIEWLLDGAIVIDVPAGTQIATRGVREHELYLALSGEWSRDDGQRTPTHLGPGALLGGASFYREDRRRVADIHAKTNGRLLVLRQSRLRTTKDAPAHVLEAQRALEHAIRRSTERSA